MPDAPDISAQTILCFDFGTGQIGVAVGQTVAASARGLSVLKARDGQPNWAQVAALVEQWRPDQLLVGLPLNMDGTESEFCRRCRKFARRLSARTGLKATMVDERLSTASAKSERFQSEEVIGGKRQKRSSQSSVRSGSRSGASDNYRDNPVDAEAAALILQTWLYNPACGLEP